MTQTKGSAISTLPVFIKQKFGEESYQKWLNTLNPDTANTFKGAILSTNWYDMKTYLSTPTKLLCDLFYQGNIKGAWECGVFSADIGLKGVYKLFVKLGTPSFIIGKASSIMSNYYNPSKMETIKSGDKSAIVAINMLPELDAYVENRIGGWIQRAMELSGCSMVKVTVPVSLTKGGAKTEFHINWS